MAVTDRHVDQTFSDCKAIYGGVRQDYFGLLYLEQEFDIPREQAAVQVAFGGNDYGIDGFHFDREKRNLYLFQFKYTDSHSQFKSSFQRLIDAGMERIFGAPTQDQNANQLVQQLKSCVIENQAILDRVCIHFVFTGDPAEAERSQVLDKLREDLENKKYLIDQALDHSTTLVIEFRSARTRKVGSTSHLKKTNTFPIHLTETLSREGPDGQLMKLAFVRLMDLQDMYQCMGQRFFERNIRAALPEEQAVNRSIAQAFKRIVIDAKDHASVFAFNHNGVTLSAEAIEEEDGGCTITEPRLLNGAQTVTTLARFLKKNEGNRRLVENRAALDAIHVLCKIVTKAKLDFVTTVTINNNRQNPVEPSSLHANDMIQLQLQDKFREDLGIYYERQENAFANLSDDELGEQGITVYKAIELRRLAQTFIVTDGDIDKLSRLREVFEDDRLYAQVFNDTRLTADGRNIVLCYKIQFRLRRLLNDIAERGANKYEYIYRARNLLWALLCQGLLNDPDVEDFAENFGKGLSLEANYTEHLSKIATTRCRFVIDDVLSERPYAAKVAEEQFGFLRTNAVYKRCMQIAYKRWRWVEKRLK